MPSRGGLPFPVVRSLSKYVSQVLLSWFRPRSPLAFDLAHNQLRVCINDGTRLDTPNIRPIVRIGKIQKFRQTLNH
ncbi:hypothetical protein D3C72_2293570 [compost metagenome]